MSENKYWKWDETAYPNIQEMNEIVIPSKYDAVINAKSAPGFVETPNNEYIVKNNKIVSLKSDKILIDKNVVSLKGNSFHVYAGDYNYIPVSGYWINADPTVKPHFYIFARYSDGREEFRFFSAKINAITCNHIASINLSEVLGTSPDDVYIAGHLSSYFKQEVIEFGEEIEFNGSTIYKFKIPGVFPCYKLSIEYMDPESGGSIVGYDAYSGVVYGTVNDDIIATLSNARVASVWQVSNSKTYNSKELTEYVSVNKVIEPNKIYGIKL